MINWQVVSSHTGIWRKQSSHRTSTKTHQLSGLTFTVILYLNRISYSPTYYEKVIDSDCPLHVVFSLMMNINTCLSLFQSSSSGFFTQVVKKAMPVLMSQLALLQRVRGCTTTLRNYFAFNLPKKNCLLFVSTLNKMFHGRSHS